MTRKLRHKGFVFQVILDGNSIIVIDDEEDAKKYIKQMNVHASNIYLLPVAIFTYKEVEK